MKPAITEAEIRAAFTADGGVLAAALHDRIREDIDQGIKETRIEP